MTDFLSLFPSFRTGRPSVRYIQRQTTLHFQVQSMREVAGRAEKVFIDLGVPFPYNIAARDETKKILRQIMNS